MFASQYDADLGAERGEGDISITAQLEDHFQDCIDEEVDLNCIEFHATVFSFPKHRMLYLEVERDRFGQFSKELF